MHGEGFFYQAVVYLAAAVVAVPVAKRLGLGSVLGYLIAGIAIGPAALGLVGEEGQDVLHFAEFGVVLMLFVIGLELEPKLLWRLRGPILGLGGLQVGISTALITAIALAAGVDWRPSLAIGMILALSSTAIVLQTLNEKGLMRTEGGQSSFAVLLFQDIAVIPMLALLPLLAVAGGGGHESSDGHGAADGGHGEAAHGTTWVEGLPGWVQAAVVLGAVVLIIVAGRFFIRPALRWIAGTRLRELFTAASLLLVVGIALLMTQVGLSPALGTFLAGVVLANSEYRHELESDIEPFKGLLLGLFFISVGASIDFGLVTSQPGRIAALVATLILVKALVLFFLGRFFKIALDQRLLFTFALAQGGEFAFVLFSFATQNSVVPTDLANLLIAVVALTMALTPILMIVYERLIRPRVGTKEAERPADVFEESNPVIIVGFGAFGSTVGRFLSANGIASTVLEIDSDRVDLLRRLGLKVFYGDATRVELLEAAGARDARIIVLATGDVETTLELVRMTRQHFPHLEIYSRATSHPTAYPLIEAGVEQVYRDSLDTSLHLGTEVLRQLGFRAYSAQRAAQRFRDHDEAALHELAAIHRDRKTHLSLARQRIRNLERLMRSELESTEEDRDAGWDVETLISEYGESEGASAESGGSS